MSPTGLRSINLLQGQIFIYIYTWLQVGLLTSLDIKCVYIAFKYGDNVVLQFILGWLGHFFLILLFVYVMLCYFLNYSFFLLILFYFCFLNSVEADKGGMRKKERDPRGLSQDNFIITTSGFFFLYHFV